jgi:nucleoside phosphorylase
MSEGSALSPGSSVLTRHTDVRVDVVAPQPVQLPPVLWGSIGQIPPRPIAMGARRPEDPLPAADIVVVTWTSAEWFALDHVFLNSAAARSSTERTWRDKWLPYSRGALDYKADPQSGALWGSFQMVEIADRSSRTWRVLLFKSNSHLAHPPWESGLTKMLQCILEDTGADRIYTIGTAGGARRDQRLGDSIVTNAALVDLQRPQNTLTSDNGNTYRCPTWFPVSNLFADTESHLLFKMNQVVTDASLAALFEQLKSKHPGDPGIDQLSLADLMSDSIRPSSLGAPKVHSLKDVALLTTDFYYIADGNNSDAYSFLEMDDGIIAREANKRGVRFACIRNISDPIVPDRAASGARISAAVRADWSGLIYETFGLQTSYNSALATWATIAGEGYAGYNPDRADGKPLDDDPLEVKLVYQVGACGTCDFFWPKNSREQPYGPYSSYDFDIDTPYANTDTGGALTSRWVTARTAPPSFPNGEVIDGCRKAPIMTIGINPNLTAFLPGQSGAAWCYPNFQSNDGTDGWTKFAWYYRYRSVYQERFSLDFAKKFVLPEGRIYAARSGRVTGANRPTDAPDWTITVRYDGDAADTSIAIPGKPGDFPYVLLFDVYPPTNAFAAGDTIAGRISVPAGIQVEVLQQQQGYYMQFVPVLKQLETAIRAKDGPNASLRVGEDVCQIDMVACASPHWNAGFLGGSSDSIANIVNNCVSSNAWAIKQMVQTRPAILYIVSKSSWDMFRAAFGAHVKRNTPISDVPIDKDYTLLRETTDPLNPAYIEFDATVDGQRYQHRTRLVITPHFSYNSNFAKQFRIPPAEMTALSQSQPACIAALTPANGFTITPPDPNYPNDYVIVQLASDPAAADRALVWLKDQFPEGYQALIPYYYDPHTQMASVMLDMYAKGALRWNDTGNQTGYLDRNEGSCQFCVNRHWQFPNECRYGKPKETPPPPDFLERVARIIVDTGKPPAPVPVVAPPAASAPPSPPLHSVSAS